MTLTSVASPKDSPFRIRVNGAENLPKNEQEGEDSLIFICAALYHAGVPIGIFFPSPDNRPSFHSTDVVLRRASV